jgi:hypothetical protein
MLRKQEMSRKNQWLVMIGLMMLALMSFTLPAAAYPSGISGYSGMSGSTCTNCHGAVSSSRAIFTGPAAATPGTKYTITFSGPSSVLLHGLDVAANAGTFTAGAGTQLMGSDITHTSNTSTATYSFTWTAPLTGGNVTIYGAGVDGYPGHTYTATFPITVSSSTPTAAATPTFSPAAGTYSSAQSVTLADTTSGAVIHYTTDGTTPTATSTAYSGAIQVGASMTIKAMATASGYNNSAVASAAYTITTASPTLTVSPSSLSFSYAAGTTTTGSKTISVGSSGAALAYTVSKSGGSWLSASGAGNTPGTVTVSANPTGLSAGTYNGSVTLTATGSTQTVPVTLTVTSTTSGGSITVSPSRLVFYASSTSSIAAQTIAVTSSSTTALSFTVSPYGCNWLDVTTTDPTTPGSISVTAHGTGLTPGTYACVIQVTSGSSVQRVPVVLVVGGSSSSSGDSSDDHGSSVASPFTFDPGMLQAASAGWLSSAGEVVKGSSNTQGLVLSKKPTGDPNAISGVTISGVAGSPLSQLGYDILATSECSARAPQFVVITTDNVQHLAHCTDGSISRGLAKGWNRVRFNPATQLTPPLQSGDTVQVIALVMDRVATTGIAVLDYISVNSTLITH